MHWLLNLLERRALVAIAIFGTTALLVVVIPLSRLSSRLVEDTALQDAMLYTEAIAQFRTLYSSLVVDRLRDLGVVATHDFKNQSHTIPLPATLSILLGQKIAEGSKGGETRLFSLYPFPSRIKTGGVNDPFEREAWSALLANPERPFYRIEQYKGQRVLRYATADLMRKSCVSCHNSSASSPKHDWKEGDLGGVLEVIRPIDIVLADMKSKILGTQILIGSLFALIIILLAMVVRQLKKAKDRVAQVAQEAKAANLAKSDFLANMSHEIRTPMNAIIGMTEILNDTPLNANQKRYVESLGKANETLLCLINDILDLSKIEAGHIHLEILEFDLDSVVGLVTDMMGKQARRKHLEMETAVAPDVPVKLRGDANRLTQILNNLIGNAIKFTQKGEIIVRVIKESESVDSVTLLFSISDTGIGIAPDKHDYVFDRFTQAEASTTRKFGGTGLGLSISKKLVELMNGKIWVESELGKGTTFHFRIPFEQAGQQSNPYLAMAELKDKEVLVVDSNATLRGFLRLLLNAIGARVDDATSCAEAIQKIANNHFDLIIMDYSLSKTNGTEIIQRINSPNAKTPTTILMITSDDIKEARLQLGRINPHVFLLNKPLKRKVFYQLIAGALSQEKHVIQDPEKSLGRKFVLLAIGELSHNTVRRIGLSNVESLYATTSVDALNILGTRPIHAVVVDLNLFGGDALQLLVTARGRFVETPFVFLLGSGQNLSGYATAWLHSVESIVCSSSMPQVSALIEDALLQGFKVCQTKETRTKKHRRLLLVDDSEDNRAIVLAFLRNLDFDIKIAHNGKEAVEQFCSGNFDMVLMDMQMPVMDGFEATKAIRSFEIKFQRPRTPILALSAYAMTREISTSLQAGCDAHISKPIKKQKLIDLIMSFSERAPTQVGPLDAESAA